MCVIPKDFLDACRIGSERLSELKKKSGMRGGREWKRIHTNTPIGQFNGKWEKFK